MKNLTKYLLIAFFSISSILNPEAYGNNWNVYYENAEVKISYQKQTCDLKNQFDQEFVLIKIENLTPNTISVEWDSKLWYDESCINCEQDNPEFRKEITIESNNTIIGNCFEHNSLRIFSRFTEKLEDMPGVDKIVRLTKFELKNLKITNE